MEKIPIKKYAYRLIIFSAIVAAASVLFQFLLPDLASPAMPFIVLFFFFMTLFTLYVVLRGNTKKDKRQFFTGYMLSRVIKMFSCLLFLLIYILANKPDGMRFAIAFIIIYFAYAIFEVLALTGETNKS